MSEVRFVYQQVYKRFDEATRIVVDLYTRGYSTSEIAKTMGWNVRKIQHLLKSIREEVAAAVEIAEQTGGNERETQRLFKSIREEVAAAVEVSMDLGGLSDDKEARARLAEFREEWLQAGSCTEPADRPRAEATIVRIYAALGAFPPRFVWCDSPMAVQLALCILERRPSSRRTALWLSQSPSLRDALGDAIWSSPLGVWLGEVLRASESWLQDALRASRKD